MKNKRRAIVNTVYFVFKRKQVHKQKRNKLIMFYLN